MEYNFLSKLQIFQSIEIFSGRNVGLEDLNQTNGKFSSSKQCFFIYF